MEEDKKEKSGLRQRAQDLRAKIADPTGTIAQEIYRKNVELARTNHTLSLLRAIDSLVLETENDVETITQGIAQAIIDNSNYLFSFIFTRVSSRSKLPLQMSGFGIAKQEQDVVLPASAFKVIELHTASAWFEAGNEHTKIIDIEDASRDSLHEFFPEHDGILHDICLGQKAASVCLVKLVARKKLVGVLLIGLGAVSSTLGVDEIEYLGRIGEASGLAIDNKLLFEENQQVLKKLQESNKKLKALDEAKDEFISMASHQLRTPLTSVKGYVSMVLEGDAGKISAQQQELLNQAFVSSQRMVYLIADLLNVSRLKTGKFVIEPVGTQLADVVESELWQLKEAAKARNLTITYEKPPGFPVLMLDETKTRQVIMNFIDNAIYYTPAGGHIKVELAVDGRTVTYKVTDDGLGVPKAEQPHLFTKFYRAENARKARPDGTGLGLFMAKKVIVAQGGSMIFESTEGKGSTFGFTFPLAAVAAPPKPATPPASA